METTPPHRTNLSGVFSDSEKIHVANYTRFIGLSFLFLPLCLYLIITPIFDLFGQLLTMDQVHAFPWKFTENIGILMTLDENHQNSVNFNIVYIIIAYVLTMCGISTITYSTHHGFSGKPVNFFTAIKSLTSTFFPILTTSITAFTIIFLFFLTFLLFVQANLMLIRNIGFSVDYNSSYLSTVIGANLIVIATCFLVNWSLAFVIVIAESKTGLSALKRSSDLVKGMRSVSLLIFLYFGLFLGILVWLMPTILHAYSDWRYVLFAMMNGVGLLMSYTRQWISVTTVLYNYCLSFHGESKIYEIDTDYVSLTSDNEKVKVPSDVDRSLMFMNWRWFLWMVTNVFLCICFYVIFF